MTIAGGNPIQCPVRRARTRLLFDAAALFLPDRFGLDKALQLCSKTSRLTLAFIDDIANGILTFRLIITGRDILVNVDFPSFFDSVTFHLPPKG